MSRRRTAASTRDAATTKPPRRTRPPNDDQHHPDHRGDPARRPAPPARGDEPLPRHCIAAAQAPVATEACRSAASTTLVSSRARVIGPTPPGLGLTQPATSATSRRDVPGDLAVDPADADVEHGGAGLDHVRRDDAGHAGRGDDDVGLAHLGGQVAGAGVAQRDRRVLAAPGEDQAERAADGDAAADDDDLARRRSARRSGAAARCSPSACTAAAPACRAPASRGSSGAARRRPFRVDPREQGHLVQAGRLLHEERRCRPGRR